MKKEKEYRIFMAAQEIAGIMSRLNNEFHEMGIRSDHYWLYDYNGTFYEDNNTGEKPRGFERYLKHTQKIRSAKRPLAKSWWTFIQMLDTLYILFYAICTYNHFIYIFGRGMFFFNRYLRRFGEAEFFLLKLFRKNVIMWMCGSDSRAPYCDIDVFDGNIVKIKEATEKKKKLLQMLEKYTVLIDYPASSHFHSKPYVHFGVFGVPIDSREGIASKKSSEIVILHAPSNLKAKGTEEIRAVIERIKNKYDIRYVEVTGVSNKELQKKILSADIVIDQLYADYPLPGLASECSINGIPVIVCGYYAECCEKTWVKPLPPNIFCMPEELEENLIRLIENEDLRKAIGEAEKEYINKYTKVDIVAKKVLSLLDGEIPEDWWFNPEDNDYIWGMGKSKDLITKHVVELVQSYGEKSLKLPENSVLRKKYMELVETKK